MPTSTVMSSYLGLLSWRQRSFVVPIWWVTISALTPPPWTERRNPTFWC